MTRRGAAGAFLLAAPPLAHAHGFGQRYDLPLPLELYVCGAALTIVVSCVMFAIYLRASPGSAATEGIDLLDTRAGRFIASPAVLAGPRALAVLFYALIVFAGLFGNQKPFNNLVPVTIWALWWVGLAYASALVGDLWKVANPLATILAPLDRRPPRFVPPARMQSWPAVALYLAFLWMEIAWEGSDSPRAIALAILGYTAFTAAGVWLFGRAAWFERGEVFSRVFGFLARFSPMRIELAGGRVSEWRLRPYAVGLIAREPLDTSEIALVLLILAGVSFDGFLETPVWEALGWPRTLGLALAPLVFAAVFLSTCGLIARSGGTSAPTTRRIAGLFVLTLVPIAIAYEVAHYLSFLVQAAQYLIPIASDPFGWGWNLFGTVNHFVRIGIIDARLVWIVSVVAIVAGHIAALYLGHVLSTREFADRRAAVRSQGPMLVLMVGYTMLSLWIIAQPIVTTR